MGSQAGQATVEWVGLVLLAALVLGGLASAGVPLGDRGLATAVAKRMSCAAGGACSAPAWRSERGSSKTAAVSDRLGAADRLGVADRLALADRLGQPDRLAVPDRLGAAAPPPPARTGSRTRVVDAFRRLRGVTTIARRLWIVCIGYRRYVYERDHPRAPHEPMPLDEALEIADACFNPVGFIEDG